MSLSEDTDVPHLLVVDDDRRLRELLRKYLEAQGFRVTVAADAQEARLKIAAITFDLLVLDIMMPGETGLDLLRSLRQESAIPVLLLTAMGEAPDRIHGLELGADDYLPKPFEPRELLLRIRTILKRFQLARHTSGPAPIVNEIRFGHFIFDLQKRILKRGSEDIHLTSAEADLLHQLAQTPLASVSREVLSQSSGEEIGNMRAVDVQITRLRRKIEDDPRFPRYLKTIRGHGYMLQLD